MTVALSLPYWAPSLEVDVGRLVRLVERVEALVPGLELAWGLPTDARAHAEMLRTQQPPRVPDRWEWARGCPGRPRSVLFGRKGGPSARVQHVRGARGSTPFDVVELGIPETLMTGGKLERCVLECAEVLEAWGMTCMPATAAAVEVVMAVDEAGAEPDPLREVYLAGNPTLAELPRLEAARGLEQEGLPARIGWLNFWSERVARSVGLVSEQDAEPAFADVRRSGDGGWLLRLTDDVLDPMRPAHVRALVEAYRRFPAIGARR